MVWDLIQRLRPYLLEVLGAAALLLLGSIVGRYIGSWGRRAAQATLDRLRRRGRGAGPPSAPPPGGCMAARLGRISLLVDFLARRAAARNKTLPTKRRTESPIW